MRFSVIIPVHNRPEPVRHAIQSVLDQTYREWECIVVDDASTDNTAQVCAEYANNDARIRLIASKQNGGVSVARNYGLGNVSDGGYLLFLDSDDRLEPNAMSRLAAVMENNDVDMVAFNSVKPPHGICYNTVIGRPMIRGKILPQHLNIMPHSEGFLLPFVWNKCYKSELIFDNSIRFDEWRKTWEDNTFIIQCLDKCNKIMVIPDMLYAIGDYPDIDHLSQRFDLDIIENYVRGYNKNKEQFGSEFNYQNNYTPRRCFDVISRLLSTFSKTLDSGRS